MNPNAVSGMVRKFGWNVDIAIRTNDTELLAGAYEDALKLPSVQTTVELERNGFVLDGVSINSNDNMQICFKRSVPYVLKICSLGLIVKLALNTCKIKKKKKTLHSC